MPSHFRSRRVEAQERQNDAILVITRTVYWMRILQHYPSLREKHKRTYFPRLYLEHDQQLFLLLIGEIERGEANLEVRAQYDRCVQSMEVYEAKRETRSREVRRRTLEQLDRFDLHAKTPKTKRCVRNLRDALIKEINAETA